jgi:DNA-binding transcriptional LysR family regulator
MEAEEALELLPRGEVDIAVAEEYDYAPRERDPSLAYRDVCRDPLVLVLPADHPLGTADPEKVPLAGLRDEPWAASRTGTAFADSLVRACRALGGFEPELRHRSNDLNVLEQLVAAGEAVSLLPSLGRPGRIPGVAVRHCAEAPLDRRIFLAARRGSTGRRRCRRCRARCATTRARSACRMPSPDRGRAWRRASRTRPARPPRRTGTAACGRAHRRRA